MKRIIFILLLVGIFSFYFITNSNTFANDYYDTVNEKFLSRNHLGDNEYIYNTFVLAQEESDKVRNSIIKDIVGDKIKIDGVSDKIKVLYNNVLDSDTRNDVSIGPLGTYIDKIMNSNNIDELISNSVIVENELGVDIFTKIDVGSDFLDNEKNIVYLYPVTFAFGSSADYYVDEDYMAYKAYIKKAIINLLEKYGMSKSEARFVSDEVISFYTSISNESKLVSDYEEVTSYYNIVDNEYLRGIYSNFDLNDYLKNRGINEFEYSLVDEGQYKAIDKYLTDDYLMLWKNVILIKILSSYANYLDMGYRDIVINLNNSLTGSEDRDTLYDDALDLVSSVFSSDIDVVYDKKVITNDDKQYLNNLYEDIKKYFKKMLETNDWLSEDTKKYALVKLDAMKVYIGLDDYSSNSSMIEITGDSLVDNVISINKSSYLMKLDMLDDNSDVRVLSESEVNAYYSSMDNAVYIPSSVMFLLDEEDSYYERLGTIGMVIAHEITHGFDYNGSMFDSNGNFSNWWNDTDRENYTRLKNEVSEYYSNIEALDGKYIDGDKTVNENIADMGALEVITGVALENGASDDELKTMYLSFAKFWRSQVTDEYAKLLLLNDSHSPNKYRVNAVLSLIDEFYDVYNVYPWNDMYLFDKDRVKVW